MTNCPVHYPRYEVWREKPPWPHHNAMEKLHILTHNYALARVSYKTRVCMYI